VAEQSRRGEREEVHQHADHRQGELGAGTAPSATSRIIAATSQTRPRAA
jgi:hypothetical protein